MESKYTTLRRKDILEMFFIIVPVLVNLLRLLIKKIEHGNKLGVEKDQEIANLREKLEIQTLLSDALLVGRNYYSDPE